MIMEHLTHVAKNDTHTLHVSINRYQEYYIEFIDYQRVDLHKSARV
jgi:hypothetical protein